jgi:hypothetical protein
MYKISNHGLCPFSESKISGMDCVDTIHVKRWMWFITYVKDT